MDIIPTSPLLNPVHQWMKPNQCLKCQKTFKNNKSFYNHRKYYCDNKHFMHCAHCKYSTNNKSNLSMHLKVRHNKLIKKSKKLRKKEKKLYKCPICNETFYYINSLQKHIEDCNKSKVSFSLNQDIIYHHRTSDEMTRFECNKCGKMYKNVRSCKRHVDYDCQK